MGEPCGLVSHGRYAAKHDPFVYYADINGWDGKAFQPSARCNEHVVDLSQLDADIAANQVPRYVFITPNLDDDMHDGSIARGDQWLSQLVPIFGRALMEQREDPSWQDHAEGDDPQYIGGLRRGAESWTMDGRPVG